MSERHHFSFRNSAREDAFLSAGWIVACVALGIAFNALGIAAAISGAF